MADLEVPNISDRIRDEAVVQRVNLLRFDSGLANDSIRILNKLEGDLTAILQSEDFKLLTDFKRGRIKDLLKIVTKTIREGYKSIGALQQGSLMEIASLQNEFARTVVNKQYGVELITTSFTATQLEAVVNKTKFEGRDRNRWLSGQAGFVRQTFVDEVQTGILSGTPVPEMVRNLRGAFSRTERDMRSLVRTFVQEVANEAQLQTWTQNEDVVEAIQQVSTLDNRTSLICIGYSGKIWTLPDFRPFGHDLPWNGGPPRHWNCRSVTVPVVRPFSVLEKDSPTLRRENLPITTRAAVIQEDRILGPRGGVKKKRIGAQVPADITFDKFLSDRSESFQDQLLGRERAELFRKGDLTLTELLDFRGNPIPLSELKRRTGNTAD